MFKRSFRFRDAASSSQREVAAAPMDSQHRVDKSARLTRKGTGSVRDAQKLAKLQRSFGGGGGEDVLRHHHRGGGGGGAAAADQAAVPAAAVTPSPIVTLTVGREGRLFAAHEDVLCQAPFFAKILRGTYFEAQSQRIALPEEEPEVFSAILEYLYKGDYYPRLLHNKHRNSWELEDARNTANRRATPHTSPAVPESTTFGGGRAAQASLSSPAMSSTTTPTTTSAAVEATVYLSSVGQYLLRDTVIYCAADRYGLEELKRLALRKQGLQAGIDVGTILRSAQYCYAHTPDSDSRLRAHYLALIIRCRKTFKRSGTMQAEMEKCGGGVYGEGGGKLFFDLFVALCNHLDDVIDASNARTPKTV